MVFNSDICEEEWKPLIYLVISLFLKKINIIGIVNE